METETGVVIAEKRRRKVPVRMLLLSGRNRQLTANIMQLLVLPAVLILLLQPVVHAEQAYPMGCSDQPPSYYDYDNYPFPPPGISIKTTDSFQLLRRLGSGKFSDVFEAVNVDKEQQLRKVISSVAATSGRGGMGMGSIQNDDNLEDKASAAVTVDPRTLAVLKCLKPVSDRKIRRELLVLSHCWRLPNLVRLLGVVIPAAAPAATTTQQRGQQQEQQQQPTTPTMPSLVLQHAGVNSQWLCHGRGVDPTSIVSGKEEPSSSSQFLTEYEIKYFICHLLVALDALHAAGIMHRDVKPRNVLINKQPLQYHQQQQQSATAASTSIPPSRTIHQTQAQQYQAAARHVPAPIASPLLLIDLGLADMYLPHTKYNVRVASRHYKSPELLVGYAHYDYAIDIWGVGCILAGLLLRREPFFRGRDNLDQLGKIIAVLGTGDLLSYMTKYNIELTPELRKVIAKYVIRGGRKKSWVDLATTARTSAAGRNVLPPISTAGLDLLDKLLVYDHAERLTAKQAMQHTYFDSVRDRVNGEVQRLFPNYHGTTTHRSSVHPPGGGNMPPPGSSYYAPAASGTPNSRAVPNSTWS